jgi:hypothetical protein
MRMKDLKRNGSDRGLLDENFLEGFKKTTVILIGIAPLRAEI